MRATNDTSDRGEKLQNTGTIEAARRAAAILQLPTAPTVTDEQVGMSAFMETGAGLVFCITTEGHFQLASLQGNGRVLADLTFEETRALFRFWMAVCTPVLMQHIREGVELVKAQRAQEDGHGNQ